MNDIIIKELQQTVANHNYNEPLRILEIGAGTGTTALQFLENIQNTQQNIHLTLLDNNPAQIESAKKKLSHLQHPSITIDYSTQDVFDYFKTNLHHFHVIYSMFTLHNFHPTPREQLISAISASLTPWWILINADKIADNDAEQHTLHYQKTLEGYEVFTQHWRKDLQQERTAHNAQDEQIKRTEKEYKNLLGKNRLTSIYESERMLMEKVMIAQKK